MTPKQVYKEQLKLKRGWDLEECNEKGGREEWKEKVDQEKKKERVHTHLFSSVAVSLLQEYEDVFLDVVPSGLLPIKGIKHQFNFILETTSPNQTTYKNNLDEIKEF